MDKMIDPNIAIGAYGNTAKIGTAGTKTAGQQVSGESFVDYMQDAARDSVETMKAGEQMSAKAITEEADLTDVVQAVTAAEITLQTVVSIRDRMVSAYQEIMRMPI